MSEIDILTAAAVNGKGVSGKVSIVNRGTRDNQRMAKSIQELENNLNQELQGGNILDAFEKFYSEDVVMQENALAPCRGKSANRERVRQWADTVSVLHTARLVSSAVSGDRAFSEWEYDVTYKNGKRHQMNEVAVRQWQNEKVIFERFYWDPATYPYQV